MNRIVKRILVVWAVLFVIGLAGKLWKEIGTCPEGTRKVARVVYRVDEFGNRYANADDVREKCEGDVVR